MRKIVPKQDNFTLRVLRFAACICLMLLCAWTAVAQNVHRVEGTVTDASNGLGIPGVNVVLKGTNLGSVTDADGRYNLQLPNGNGVLVFSFVGYSTQEVEVSSRTAISVALSQEATQINEVVVTALGIEREKQSLGYATQELNGDQLNEAREANFTSMLSGKVAGLDIKSNAGVGSSTRIILRGESSLNFNGNQPLFVVDGIPINNSINNTSSADFGNGASEINPADIESVNVLKGPAAAALYGARASNGVIIITTKSGKGQRGLGISVNTGITFEDVLRLPRFQRFKFRIPGKPRSLSERSAGWV
jgi:TonB-dependent SusC/RagA subfamily outer membrane receptor